MAAREVLVEFLWLACVTAMWESVRGSQIEVVRLFFAVGVVG
jgi:hypothetical protein